VRAYCAAVLDETPSGTRDDTVRLRRELSAVSASGTSSQEVTAEIADLQRRIERQIANLEAENTTPALRRRITTRIAELEEAVEERRQRATVLCITRTPSCTELADPSNAKRSDADERPDSRGAEVLEGPSVQGPGKVAVCTKCPNMPAAGI